MKKIILLTLYFIQCVALANPPIGKDVFHVKVQLLNPNTFTLTWSIKEGYFLYKNRLYLSPTGTSNIRLGTIQFPPSLKKKNAQGIIDAVYRNTLTLPISVLGESPGETLMNVHYQGCADDGYCYPPEVTQIKITIDTQQAMSEVSIEAPSLTTISAASPHALDRITHIFASSSLFFITTSFFLLGILLAFTPCILPMVPVLSGIIVGHSKTLTIKKAFLLSLSYVLSMACTYALIGAVLAGIGKNLQIIMQSPWIIISFSLLFVALALSMFHVYTFRLPLRWQNALAGFTRHTKGGHYLNAMLMGSLSILILSPCVTPPLIGTLSYIAQTGNILIGSMSLFFLSLGMGTPLLLIGTSYGKWLPKAGQWMENINKFFGVILLGVAIYLLERILPGPITMTLWGTLILFSSILIANVHKKTKKYLKLRRILGLLCFIYGLVIIVGASQGQTNPLYPLNVRYPRFTGISNQFITVHTLAEAQQALNNNKGKPVLIDFYADWCTSCKYVERYVINNPKGLPMTHQLVIIKVDLTPNTAETQALLQYFNVVAPPTLLFFNALGKPMPGLTLIGNISPNSFLISTKKVLGESF